MEIIEQARKAFTQLCEEENVDATAKIDVQIIHPESAVGPEADTELAVMQGKEHVLQATYNRFHGQAFTPAPSSWVGTVDELLKLDLSDQAERSIFVASMNSVLRSLQDVQCTEHCRGKGPIHCAPEIASRMDVWFGKKKYALIGFQPMLLKNLADQFGADNVKVLDLQHYYIGNARNNVEILHGMENLEDVVEWADVGIASGTSIVYDTIDAINKTFREARKPVIYFGTTISGAAALTGLQRICPFGH